MGVSGLQKLMKSECEGGFEFVSLLEIAELYRCKTGENPVMFYETSSSFCDLLLDPVELHVGGGLKKFKKYVELFIKNFFELGITLKVVVSGIKRPYKHEAWIENNIEIVKSLENLFLNKPFKDIGVYEKLILYLVANLAFQVSDKCEYMRAVYGADEYIINYVKKFNCFAVLTNDSNLILMEGAEFCLSSRDLDLGTMTTCNFNRKNLAKHLNLSTSHLPVFGSLFFGSMYRSSPFYKKHIATKKDKFYKISEFARALPSGEEILEQKQSAKKILQMQREDVPRWIENLKFFCGFSEIDIMNTNNKNWNEILSVAEKRHTKGVATIIYGVLRQQTVYLSPDFANVLKPMPDSALLPLRKQLYGILFFEYPYTKISVTEHCFEYCEDIKKAKYICRIVKFKRNPHPGLLKMWSSLPFENIQEEKRRVFCKALDKKLNPNDIEDIEEELLFPFLATFYLFWKSEIKFRILDIKILLIQAILVNSLSVEEIEKYPSHFDKDAIDLSFWFIKTVNHFNFLNFACGEPFCLLKTSLVNYFDGKILYHVYKSEKNEKHGSQNSKTWKADVWRKFKFLKNKLHQTGFKCGLDQSKKKLR